MLWLIGAVVVSLLVASAAGAFRAESLDNPPRLNLDRPILPMAAVMAGGVVVWVFVVPVLYGLYLQARGLAPPFAPATAPTTTPAGPANLRPEDLIVLGTVSPLIAYVVLLAGNAYLRPRLGQRLGVGLADLPGGLWKGAVGIVAAMPLVYFVMVLTDWFYRAIGFQHPPEHDLLRTMGETADWRVRAVAIVSAGVVAPLWEELLFRGFLQTIVKSALLRRGGPGLATAGSPHGAFPVTAPDASRPDLGVPTAYARHPAPPDTGTASNPCVFAPAAGPTVFVPAPPPEVPVLPYFGTPPELEADHWQRALRVWVARRTWLAIALTSAVFAGVHEKWTWVPIFFLSLCLGWVYERTNNLWAPTTLHALFNALMTLVYLLTTRA